MSNRNYTSRNRNSSSARNTSGNRNARSSSSNSSRNISRGTSGSSSGSSSSRNSTTARNMSVNSSRINKKKRKRRNRILRNVGYILSLILLVITIVFIVFMNKVNLLPGSYEVLIAALLILIAAFVFVTQRWVGMGIFTKILAVILSVVLIVGTVYLNATEKALKKMSNTTTVTSVVGVYVLKDSGYDNILKLDKAECGKLSTLDKENTDKLVQHIADDSKISLNYKEYDGIAQMVEALYSGSVEAIIFNDSYLGILKDVPEYSNFEEKTKCIYTQKYETVIEKEEAQQTTDDHIIAMYISGIDARSGGVNINSNSDVNIICIANFKTHQILLVNTPRDYYIPTSVSNGAKDKLTHAGTSGVECSMETLELLYDTNLDYYFKVNFTGFIQIVDQLGGITVHSDYDFVTTHGGDHIVKGKNYLTGKQALGFVRERYAFATGDNQRGKNTMTVIKALVNKMASSAMLANYTNVLNSISDCMVTNMSYDKIGEIAKQQLNGMPSWDVQQFSVEGTGATKSTYSYKPPTYVMIPKQETVDQAKEYIKAICNNEIVKTQ